MVAICEVGPRDGLQIAPVTLSPSERAELIRRLEATGLRRLEVASFVDPRLVPQMDGAEELVSLLPGAPDVARAGLVLNRRGYERARGAGLTSLRFAYAVSDYFNRRNAGVSAKEGRDTAAELARRAAAEGIEFGIVLATAFGCPFTGLVDPAAVEADFSAAVEVGADEVIFADTVGVGVPSQVRRFADFATGQGVRFGFHLHNTRNTGYANAWEAVQRGAEVLDSSIGGLGGCPFAPNASGNIATEDLAYMLQREGVTTGVDVKALIETARWLERASELKLDGLVHKVPWFPEVTVDDLEPGVVS